MHSSGRPAGPFLPCPGSDHTQCVRVVGPSAPGLHLRRGHFRLTCHLPCGFKASRSFNFGKCFLGKIFFFFFLYSYLLKAGGMCGACVCVLNTFLFLRNTHSITEVGARTAEVNQVEEGSLRVDGNEGAPRAGKSPGLQRGCWVGRF